MASITVTASTSVILVDTSQFANAVVFLPSLYPGHTVTIRDSIGYLSTPNKITVSTVSGISFADGTRSVTIQEAFGYLSVTSRDATSWILTNSFGFPQNRSVANVSSLNTDSITTNTIYASNSIGTQYITALNATLQSVECSGWGQFSTLVLGAPFTTVPGATVTVNGFMTTSLSATVGGNMTVAESVTCGAVSTAAISGTSLALQGSLSVGGNISAPAAIITADTILATKATINSVATSTISGSTLAVNTITASSSLITSILNVSSSISLQGLTITPVNSTIVLSAGLAIPSLTTDYLNVSSSVNTANLTIYRSILAPTMTSFIMSEAAIINPNGSLTISTIHASTITAAVIQTGTMNTSTLTASSIAVSGSIIQPAAGYISVDTAIMKTLSTGTFYGGVIRASTFSVTDIDVNSLDITGTFTGSTLTSLYIPNALITSASIQTSSIQTSTLSANSLVISSGYISTSSSLTIAADSLVINGNVSSRYIQAVDLAVENISASRLVLGSPVDPTIRGPYLICTDSTNCIVTGGPGDYFSPFFLSNVKPPSYVPGTPYTVGATFSYVVPPNGYIPGNLLSFKNTLFWANELDTKSFITGDNNRYMISELYGYYAQDLTSNVTPVFQYTDMQTAAVTWNATMLNDSKTTLTVQSLSNANLSLVDPNVYINMQNGVLKWNYALNDTTIQNSLNDISTRNLLYYGSLRFVSDPRLKQNIQPANLRRCHDIIRDIPLHRYEFIDSYVSAFQVTDKRRLGIIADEYEQFFPKSVSIVKSPLPGLSTIKTVDTQQLDMAHLGATQYLLKEIAELRAVIEALEKERGA